MPKVEIDETELVQYRNIAGAVQKMLANPQTRGKLLEAQKIINPNAVIPEIDAQKPLHDAIGSLNKKIDDLAKDAETRESKAKEEKALTDLRTRWEAGRAKARRAGYTADGLDALEKFMEENGVADHAIAMPAFERENPPATAMDASGGNRFDVLRSVKPDGDDMKLLVDGDERQFLNKRINETLSGIRSGNL
jgi:hypothetical protein